MKMGEHLQLCSGHHFVEPLSGNQRVNLHREGRTFVSTSAASGSPTSAKMLPELASIGMLPFVRLATSSAGSHPQSNKGTFSMYNVYRISAGLRHSDQVCTC